MSDALGRLVRVDEPNPSTGDPGSVSSPAQPTSYTYDLLGNLTTVTQSSGSTTQLRRFAYDSLSRLIFAANPEQSSSSLLTFNNQSWAVKYEYDDASNLRAKSDSRLNSQGLPLKVSFTYDNLHRLTTRSYNDTPLTPSVTYTYDTATNGVGRLASVITAGVSTYNYTSYDSLGRLTSYNQVTAGQTYPMACSYNLAGLMTSQTYPSGKVVKTDYDSAGRISGVSNQSGTYYAGSLPSDNTNRLQYSPAGPLTAIKFGNQLWEHTDFNSRQQATLIGLGVNKSDSSKLKLDFDYGSSANNGNLLSQKITSPSSSGSLLLTQTYTYDFLNRLSTSHEKVNQESSPRWSQVYSYDRFANRTSITNSGELPFFSQPAVDPATNRHVALSYDAAGNQLSDVAGRPLTYDADSHVRSFTSGSITYTYSYDGDGRRVRRDFNDGSLHTTVYVYDASGLMLAEYTSDPIVTVPPADATSYLTSDQLGSPRVVTRSDGSVKARHDYLPFGEDVASNISGRSTVTGYVSQDGLRQKFTSKERDAESGLDYFLARYYSSAQGRFISPDEFTGGPDELFDFTDDASDNPTFYADLHNPQSLNKYQYGYYNPFRYIDPDGHDSEEIDPEPQGQAPKRTPLDPLPYKPYGYQPGDDQRARQRQDYEESLHRCMNGDMSECELIMPTPPDISTIKTPEVPKDVPGSPLMRPVPMGAEHTKGRRKSTLPKHQKGEKRKKTDKSGEKADQRRKGMPGKKDIGRREKERQKKREEERQKRKRERQNSSDESLLNS